MSQFLIGLHSGVRWLVVLVTLLALARLIWGVAGKLAYDRLTQRVMLAFMVVMTAQWVIGLVLFFALDSLRVGFRWEHTITMTLAVACAHLPARWKDAPDAIRYRNGLILVIAALVLVFIGVQRLPQGWRM